MILNTRRDRSPRLARSRLGLFTAATAMLATVAIAAGPRLVVAQPTPETAPLPPGALVVDATPAALPTEASVDYGPKPKPNRVSLYATQPLAAVPSAPEVPATPPIPVVLAVAAEPEVSPVPAVPPPGRASKRSLSVEERLARIERVLEQLEARDGIKVRPGGAASPYGYSYDARIGAKGADEDQKRTAESAQRAAEAGQRNAERAVRDMAKLKDRDFQRLQESLSELQAEAPQQALEALRSARESLGRQMQELERQIKHLEEDRSRSKPPVRGRPESSDEAPKAKDPFEQSK